jgi:hypothetical protein
MRSTLLALLLFVPFSPIVLATEQPDPIPRETSTQLVEVLGNLEIIADRSGHVFRVRLYRLPSDRFHTECGRSPESCPHEFVYVLISGYDEAPDQALYRLPNAFGWRFREWLSDPEDESGVVRFLLERQVVSTHTQLRWWNTEIYEISVNLSSATMRMLPP